MKKPFNSTRTQTMSRGILYTLILLNLLAVLAILAILANPYHTEVDCTLYSLEYGTTKKKIAEYPLYFDETTTGSQYGLGFCQGRTMIGHVIFTGLDKPLSETRISEYLSGLVTYVRDEELAGPQLPSDPWDGVNQQAQWVIICSTWLVLTGLLLTLILTCVFRYSRNKRLQPKPRQGSDKNTLQSILAYSVKTLPRDLALLVLSILSVSSLALWIPQDYFRYSLRLTNNYNFPYFNRLTIYQEDNRVVFRTIDESTPIMSSIVRHENFAFSYYFEAYDSNPDITDYRFSIKVEYWLLAVLFGIYSFTAFYRGPLRRYRRYKQGHCVTCGYDSRGNSGDICPECGSALETSDTEHKPHQA